MNHKFSAWISLLSLSFDSGYSNRFCITPCAAIPFDNLYSSICRNDLLKQSDDISVYEALELSRDSQNESELSRDSSQVDSSSQSESEEEYSSQNESENERLLKNESASECNLRNDVQTQSQDTIRIHFTLGFKQNEVIGENSKYIKRLLETMEKTNFIPFFEGYLAEKYPDEKSLPKHIESRDEICKSHDLMGTASMDIISFNDPKVNFTR